MTGRARSTQLWVTRWLAGIVAAALVLTGCSGDDAAPEADPSPAASAETEQPSDAPTVETPDGGEVVTSGELGEDFPAKQVPTVKGTVLSAASSPDGSHNIVMLVDGEPKKVSKKAVKKLKKAGFKVKDRRATPGAFVTELRSPEYKVEVAATESGVQTSLNYVILPR